MSNRNYDYKKCGAKTRAGGKCKQRAMRGGRCYIHGGKSPGGVASPHFKTGRYSDYIPGNLAQDYEAALADKDPLSLQPDVVLLRALTAKYVAQTGQGDTHPAWIEVKQMVSAIKEAMRTGNKDALRKLFSQLDMIIAPHYRAARAEEQVVRRIEQIGKVADKERRLLIDRQKVMTIEQALALCTSLTLAITGIVKKHCEDKKLERLILSDTDIAFTRTIGGGSRVIEVDK